MAENFQHNSEIVVDPFQAISSVFNKRAGSTDRGKEYEHLYITNLALKLVADDTVEDFFLSSNDNKFGFFDDVVVTIKYYGKKETETYAIQLKQSKNKVLRSRDLSATKGKFSIKEYLEDYYKTIKPAQNRIKLILLTNCKKQIDETITTEVNGEEIGVKISSVLEDDLISTCTNGRCHVLKSESKYDDFFQNFFLYTDQADVHQIQKLTSKLFTDVFHCNSAIFKDFANFVTNWSLKEGSKEKLSKRWMEQVIALCILTPFIRPLSFVKVREIDNKSRLFSAAVSKFHVTTLGRDNFGKIKNLWQIEASELVLDITNKVRLKYQIGIKNIQNFEDFSNDDKETNKLLWLLGKCPLVVEENQGIYKAVKLCQNLSLVVLTTNLLISREFNCFQNLSDLKTHEHLYEEVLTNFTYSLECQKETPLKALLEIDDHFDTLLTTDILVQMLLGPLDIGCQEKILPPCHVSRTICKISIDPTFLNQLDTSFIVVTAVKDFEMFRLLFCDLQIVDSEDGLEINFPKKTNTNLIYLSRRDYNQNEFDQLCRGKTRRKQCHQFRYINSECLEWIRSSNVQEVKQFRLDHEYVQETLPESDLFGNGENQINIVCANSGMGKSTLMKSLKYSSDSSTWTLLVCARNHSMHYRQKLEVDTFLKYIWAHNCKDYNDKEKIIFRTLMSLGKVRLIWDGLDEISKDSLDNILFLVKEISKRGIKQWITARNNLKNILEDKLQTFARRMKEFDAEEQRCYIKKRLNLSNDELFELFKKIKTNIHPFSNSDVLGIPLQVYMLTELFVRDEDKYTKLLNQSFTILDLYQNFVWEKFKLYYEEKMKLDLGIGNNYQKCMEEMKQRIERYKRVASGVHFAKGILDHFYKTSDNFLEEIKQFGDHVGFVSNVANDSPEFVHNSFGDYFTALYLHDNDPHKPKDYNFVNNDGYNNIRFFLDLLLCQNSKAHLAILFKNSSLLDECSEQELTQLDAIGRTVLELSCSWSYQYEIAELQRIGFGRFNIHTKYLSNEYVKKLQYRHDFNRIDVLDIRVKKILLLMPFLIPQYIKHVDDECAALLLYYSVVFDHVIILKYMDNIVWLKKAYERFEPKYLLSVALIYESHKVLQELIMKEEYRQSLRGNLDILLCTCRFGINGIFSLFSKHVIDINELIFFACRQGRLENVRFLVNKDVKTDIPDGDGCYPMHHACDNDIDGFRIVEFLITKNEDANVLDFKRRLPLHYVCMNTKFATKILKILNTQNLDVLDIYQRAPLHYACDNDDSGYAIAEFLVMKRVKLDQQDINSCTPMHYACMNWKFGFQIIKLLLDHFANCNILDCKNRTALHYACKNYYRGFDIAKLMITKGVDPNLEDSDGRMPIHYACESGKFETVKLLISKINRTKLFSGQNQTLLHVACKNYSHGYEICELLLYHGFSVNSIDNDARSPLHVACEFGKPETVKLLLSRGAPANVQDVRKRLPFHYACMNIYHSSEIVQILINFQSRIGVLDRYDRLPIHYACKKANVYSVSLLIQRNNTQIFIPDSYGRLPIHYACCNFNNGSEIVKYLLNEGASLNVGDRYGRMPIHYACETGNIYLVRLLSEVGTILDVKDDNNRTPLDYAHDAENYNIVHSLTTE